MRTIKYGKTIAAAIVVFALFNVITFAIPFARTAAFWSGYVFGMLSILIEVITAITANSSGKSLKSRFYGWPVLYISSVYMVVQLVASLIFMAASGMAGWIPAVVSVILLSIALLGMLATSAASAGIQQTDNVVEKHVFYLKSLEAEVSSIALHCDNQELRSKLDNLAEKIRYSDPMSKDELRPLEDSLTTKCGELRDMVATGNAEAANAACRQMEMLLEERNQKCRLMK